jgi:hypothetical protein
VVNIPEIPITNEEDLENPKVDPANDTANTADLTGINDSLDAEVESKTDNPTHKLPIDIY